MILKELHLTDALGRISFFRPLTHNGEVRILTWPKVIDISKIRDIQIVGTSGLIQFWKLEKILLRTVAVARAYTFLEVRSRDSTWWPDLMWPRHNNFTTDVKLINEKVCQVWLCCSLSFSSYPRKTTGGGGAKMTPHQGEGLRPAGGVWTPPCGFPRIAKNGGAQRRLVFTFLATFVKVSILGHARSGHQVRSSDHTLQKLYNRAPAIMFEGKLWNFRNMIRSSVPIKCISWIFDIGDFRSGHFRDLPIISQRAKIKLPVLCFILSLYEWNRIR